MNREKMKYYRVTFNGYLERLCESKEEALNAFLEVIEDECIEDNIDIEVYDEKSETWSMA